MDLCPARLNTQIREWLRASSWNSEASGVMQQGRGKTWVSNPRLESKAGSQHLLLQRPGALGKWAGMAAGLWEGERIIGKQISSVPAPWAPGKGDN